MTGRFYKSGLRFVGVFLLLLGGLRPDVANAERIPLVWPTPNRAFLEGGSPSEYVQPTVSGRIESGLYGCTRTGGRQFHEGLDLKTIGRDRNGRASDPIFAAMPGRVAYVNRVGGNSSYGIYVVLEHEHDGINFYTLYAHMRMVDEAISVGTEVEQGAVLGIIGTTAAGYTIPRSRAHVHFEMGLQLDRDFNWWYKQQPYGSRNLHGSWNGMNLLGWDPLEFYRLALAGEIDGARDYLQGQPVALRVRVYYPGVPDLAARSPGLVGGALTEPRGGWDVDFSPYGIPLSFRPVPASVFSESTPGVSIISHDSNLAFPPCRDLLDKKGSGYVPGSDLERTLELLFGK